MALWPFGKKKNEEPSLNDDHSTTAATPAEPAAADTAGDVADTAAPAVKPVPSDEDLPRAAGVSEDFHHDPVGGNTGPFDGDSVDIEDFDFSDFSVSILNLGSMRIPLPKDSQVQVEMGEQGPKMLHIVTTHGRITPVAFAAPSSGGQWNSSVDEIAQGMRGQGMPTTMELGPWGREVVGTGVNGTIRILGMDGPRWMLRMTLAAPEGKGEELAALAREVAARTFVYRGDNPILAGNSLPVMLPAQLAEQVQKAIQQRNQQAAQQAAQAAQAGQPGQPGQAQPAQPAQPADENQMHDAMRRLMDGNAGNDATGTEGTR